MNKFLKNFLDNQFNSIFWGSIKVNFKNNYEKVFNGKEAGLTSNITIHDDTIVKDVLYRGELGFAEGYINNKWDSSNLNNLLKFY